MKTLLCSNFRGFHYDAQAGRYRATIDVFGTRGLFRVPYLREEEIERAPGALIWRFRRNGELAPLQVSRMEAAA